MGLRVRNKKTTILGAIKPPEDAMPILLASASGHVAPSSTCNIKGNVNRAGACIYHTPEKSLVRQDQHADQQGNALVLF